MCGGLPAFQCSAAAVALGSLLVGRSLNANVSVVYAPNTSGERHSFYRQLWPVLDDSKRLVLKGDWNAILDPKVAKGRWGARRLERYENSLIDFLAEFDLIDRFHLDHPGREMWMGNLPFGQVRTYQDRMLVKRAEADFVSCPTFLWIGLADHKLIRVSLRLVSRPSLASYWKFNTSLLEIRDFREWLETLIQRALVGAVTGNRLRESLKFRIRDFAIKYGQQLQLDRAKKAKSLEGRLSRGYSLAVDLAVDQARKDLEREVSKHYKDFVVRNRIKRVSNEAMRCNAFMHKEELRKYTSQYIEFVKSLDGHMLHKAFWAHFRDHFARCPDFPVQEFRNYLADLPHPRAVEAASCEGLVMECEVPNALKQVGLNKSPGLDGLPDEVYLRMSHMFVPILTDGFNQWFAQGAIVTILVYGVGI